MSAKVVRLWQAIFFDLDPIKDSISWRMNHVVWREHDAGNLQLAGNLHTAGCGGPRVARRLLDGPQPAPQDPEKRAAWMREQTEISAIALSLSYPQSREEFMQLQKLAVKMALEDEKVVLAKTRLANKRAKEERSHEHEKDSIRRSQLRDKAVAKRHRTKSKARVAIAKARVAALAEREKLRLWQLEQLAAQDQRELDARQARIAASALLTLPWGQPQENAKQASNVLAEQATSAVLTPAVSRNSVLPRLEPTAGLSPDPNVTLACGTDVAKSKNLSRTSETILSP